MPLSEWNEACCQPETMMKTRLQLIEHTNHHFKYSTRTKHWPQFIFNPLILETSCIVKTHTSAHLSEEAPADVGWSAASHCDGAAAGGPASAATYQSWRATSCHMICFESDGSVEMRPRRWRLCCWTGRNDRVHESNEVAKLPYPFLANLSYIETVNSLNKNLAFLVKI